LAVFALAFFCLMFSVFWGIGLFGNGGSGVALLGCFGLLVLGTCALVANAFMTAVILTTDRIEIRRLWGRKTLSFAQIRGVRTSSHPVPGEGDAPDVRHFKIEPNHDHLPAIEFDDIYGFDEVFYRWLRGLPDLGAINPKTSRSGPV
jgi:hypothetical protein